MFFVPAMTFAHSSNTGDSVEHSRRAIEHVRTTWPFFNRTAGADHFLWLTGDRGACAWPGESAPALANVIKVVHWGWHRPGRGGAMPAGWGALPNQRWGCFRPSRDIVAAPYWLGQGRVARGTWEVGPFNTSEIPPRLLFFAGGVRRDQPDYSNGVRQEFHSLFGAGQHPDVTIHEGPIAGYVEHIRSSRFCLAPSGYGWGIRLSQLMAQGCVPVIVQDGVSQPWEDMLPYEEFSVRIPQRRIPQIAALLAAVPDETYLALRTGVARHWRAFVWTDDVGGEAYDFMIRSLRVRWRRLSARMYDSYPLVTLPAPTPAPPKPLSQWWWSHLGTAAVIAAGTGGLLAAWRRMQTG